ncbi:MAG: tripartite tricarboxylate transporter substrate-binding protein, partial [Pigmentiphaga sp.]|nr:tripartite tricarboxylate transporter substrate-binding protein [Pigmentiphaga sp.]
YVVMAPKGLPSSVSTVLRRAFADAVKDPGVVQRFQQLDLQPETLSGETARVRLEEQAERYGRLVNAAGVTVN